MIAFEVKDMSCNHCVGSLTAALRALDPAARLHFDLATKRVDIDAATADAAQLAQAMRDAGYTPVAIPAG